MSEAELSKKNECLAQSAMTWVKSKLSLGFGNMNYPFSERSYAMKVNRSQPNIEKVEDRSDKQIKQIIHHKAWVAEQSKTGACMEVSAMTFDYLARQNVRPIAIMCRDSRFASHAFVVLGYDKIPNYNDPWSFPDYSWVSDAWAGNCYRTNTLTRTYSYRLVFELREGEQYI